jgi:hypothetical protein
VSSVVIDALTALGPAPVLHKLEIVASALGNSGDPEVLALFGLGAHQCRSPRRGNG